ncbi:MAG: hypothetical protein JF593_13060 [Novosphingobium sp.]|nr:hypothetical protein [Novosphingobium sp.]
MKRLRHSTRAFSLAAAMKRGTDLRIRTIGHGRHPISDLFYELMRMSWPAFAALFIGFFASFNVLFGAIYAFDPGGLSIPPEHTTMPVFWRDFFFSVHTVATIGYGNVYPLSVFANIVVVVEVTLGILFFALTTGIVFARFSRPTARILFSEKAVVRDIDGVPTLMLRAANQRHNLIYAAEVRVSLLEDEDVGGTTMRRFRDLALIRESNPVFALTWTIMHRIEGDSPLVPWLAQRTMPNGREIVVLLSGFDQSSGQTIYDRTAYLPEDIAWGSRFIDIVGLDDSGTRTIDYGRFHEVTAERPADIAGATTSAAAGRP